MASLICRLHACAVALLAFAQVACSDDSTPANTGGPGSVAATSSSTGAGGAGMGGAGGTGAADGAVPIGDRIDAPENEWTWVDFPDSRCMNDTPTGIGINKASASKDVIIFLMGGNACFNAVSCGVTANAN